MILRPAKQLLNNKFIFGFDVETYDDNKKLYCISLYDLQKESSKTFFKKRDFINEIKKPYYENSLIAATNLQFDFFAVFAHQKEEENFNVLFRGSHLVFCKTFLHKKIFSRKAKSHKASQLVFLDTMNYAQIGVKKLGALIGNNKLKKPACLGRLPKNKKERDELITYNHVDAEISAKGLSFLKKSFEKLGATFRLTIASTAMSLFKNNYLKETFFRHDPKILLELMQGYYGGRTEAFMRGRIPRGYRYYDVNSLYPFVMRNRFPNPNTLRTNHINSTKYINAYEGLSNVTIFCPRMEYPLLPYRHDNKLLFPTGTFTSWQSHVELRKAVELGYVIKKVHKTHYYKETCDPFTEYVSDLYEKRKEVLGKPMAYVIKLLMNSLYGKFGQRFTDRDDWVYAPTIEQIERAKYVEQFGEWFRFKKPFTVPAGFIIPIWAIYTTAYARLHLYNLIVQNHAVYCDTDSIISTACIPTNNQLGGLKCEMVINDGIIVKPKFYALTGEGMQWSKLKGYGMRLTFLEFNKLLLKGKASFKKFAKFKESIRRGLITNEILNVEKSFSLEDNKREWKTPFHKNEWQSSKPLFFEVELDNALHHELETKIHAI